MDWTTSHFDHVTKEGTVGRVEATHTLMGCWHPQDLFANPTDFAERLKRLIASANKASNHPRGTRRKLCLIGTLEMSSTLNPDEKELFFVQPGFCSNWAKEQTTSRQLRDWLINPFIEQMIANIHEWNERGSGWIVDRVVSVCLKSVPLSALPDDDHLEDDREQDDLVDFDGYNSDFDIFACPGFVLVEHLNPCDLEAPSKTDPSKRLGLIDFPAPNGECFKNAIMLGMLRAKAGTQAVFNDRYRAKKWQDDALAGLDWTGTPDVYVTAEQASQFIDRNPSLFISLYSYNKDRPPRQNLIYDTTFGSPHAEHKLNFISFKTASGKKHLISVKDKAVNILLHTPSTDNRHICPYCEEVIIHQATVRQGVKIPWRVRRLEHQRTCLKLKEGKPRLYAPVDGKQTFRLALCGDVHERITADIECVTLKEPAAPDAAKNTITAYQEPVMVGATHTYLSIVQDYKCFVGEDCIEQFLRWISKIEEDFVKRRNERVTNVAKCKKRMNIAQTERYEAAVICVICRGTVVDKVLHHCPFSVQPFGDTGAACRRCNSGVHTVDFLPVLFFNLNYDFSFIMEKMMKVRRQIMRDGRIMSAVPKGTPGKFIQFEIKKKLEEVGATVEVK